jgi:hypothetical protein
MKKCYISGPISGLSIRTAQLHFAEAAKEVEKLGFIPINPMVEIPFEDEKTWEQYMIDDIKLLFSCDSIFMLNNWKGSTGARIEHAIAIETGKNIIYG